MSGKYHFLPWVRQGATTLITQEDTFGSDVSPVVKHSVYLKVNDQEQSKEVKLRFYGPGDVKGIHRRLIFRTDPVQWARDFEPNYFPIIDFDSPGFPWLFTPAVADEQQRLRPWICLVVLPVKEGISISHNQERPLPVLTIKSPAQPSIELPSLSESWAWAHAQVTTEEEDSDLEEILKTPSSRTLSRLICPRRLKSNQAYYACLVPTFEAGRKTGLGIPLKEEDEQALHPAWLSSDEAPEEIELPLYYHWEFSTGEKNDFEALIKRLVFRPLPEGIGYRDMASADLPFELPAFGTLAFEGALRPPTSNLEEANFTEEVGLIAQFPLGDLIAELDQEVASEKLRNAFEDKGILLSEWASIQKEDPPLKYVITDFNEQIFHVFPEGEFLKVFDLPVEFIKKMQTILNLANTYREDTEEDPTVGPPIYGSTQSAQYSIPEDGIPSYWLRQLNLDPRFRAMAGLGALVIQDQQDELLSAAWEQLGDGTINQDLIQLQLAQEVNQAIYKKQIEGREIEELDETNLLQFTAQAHSSVPLTDEASEEETGTGRSTGRSGSVSKSFHTANAQIRNTALPDAMLSPEFRRITRKRGPLANRIRPKTSTASLETKSSIKILLEEKHQQIQDRINKKNHLNSEPTATSEGGNSAGLSDIFKKYLDFVERLKNTPEKLPTLESLDLLPGIKQKLTARLDPKRTINHLAWTSFEIPSGDVVVKEDNGQDRLSNKESETHEAAYFDPVSVIPQFFHPMYKPLAEISKDYLLPGIDRIPENTVTLLESNPAFIEAYMVGLNHEMSRELLWRDFPSHQRGSYFPLFWNEKIANDEQGNTHFIHTWDSEKHLGEHYSSGEVQPKEQLVLLIRGDLIRRFPSAVIFLANISETKPLESQGKSDWIFPLFQGNVNPDINFFGFDLTVEEVTNEPDWYFVIQQQPTKPRFGFNTGDWEDHDAGPDSWRDLKWQHLVDNQEELDALNYLSLSNDPDFEQDSNVVWGKNGAHMAWICLQRPYRVGVPVHQFLTQNES